MTTVAPDIADALLGWGLPRLRDLPWRTTRDPWQVLVSEVMLQQTQAARVVARWQRFVARWPTAAACGAAPLADVLVEWQGLGYPRRARNLHAAARLIAVRGSVPDDLEGLLALPGVGAYTARAVLAFAFERDVGVVDTNVARVYARLAGQRLTAREVQTTADAAVPEGYGWAWNQCLIDLGATVCRPRPDCAACPLARRCGWRGAGAEPAAWSAGVSTTQARFDGSDRQARGRLMRALTERGQVRADDAAAVMQRPAAVAARLVADLTGEGLCTCDGEFVRLPDD